MKLLLLYNPTNTYIYTQTIILNFNLQRRDACHAVAVVASYVSSIIDF